MTRFLDELERQLRATAEREAEAGAPASGFVDALEDRLCAAAVRQAGAGGRVAEAPVRRPRRQGARRRLLVLAVAALAGLAVPAVAAVTSLWSPDVAPEGPRVTMPATAVCEDGDIPPQSSPTTTEAPVGEELTSLLGALRRPRTPADDFDVRDLQLGVRGAHVDGIRAVGTAPNGQRYFVVPVDSVARTRPQIPERCLARLPEDERRRIEEAPELPSLPGPLLCFQSGRGGNCGTTVSRLREQGALSVSATPSGNGSATVVAGLVPDGVRAVTLRYGRSERTFSVEDNFYAFEVGLPLDRASRPDETSWQLDDGTTRPIA